MTQAQALIGKGDLKQGTEILEHVDKTFPTIPELSISSRSPTFRAGTNQAMAELDQAVSIAPKYVEAIVLLAQLRLRAGDAICYRVAGICIEA